MSGVSMDERLYCEKCNKITLHHTQWDREHESDVYAQCEHFGPRLISGLTQARNIKGMCYWFLV